MNDPADKRRLGLRVDGRVQQHLLGLVAVAGGAALMIFAALHWEASAERAREGRRRAEDLARSLPSELDRRTLEDILRRDDRLAGVAVEREGERLVAGRLPEQPDALHRDAGAAGTVIVALRPEAFEGEVSRRFLILFLPTLLALVVSTWLAAHLERRRRIRLVERGRAELARVEAVSYADPVNEAALGVLGPAIERLRRILVDERAELRDRNQELETAAQLKGRFLANMSHEIRTPLTAILGFTEMLDDPELPADRRQRALDTVRRNGRHLLLIVNDVLDLSKIQAGRMTVERIPVSLREIVQDIEEVFTPRAVANQVSFDVTVEDSVPKLVESDPTRLRQILANLVGNALKFTSEGEVILHAAATVDEASDEAVVEIRVRDTGVGMSEESQRRIFEPFMQADTSVTRRFGGTGLGLAISRQLAEILGGELNCTSRSGEGSEFVLTIRGAVCRSASQAHGEHAAQDSSEIGAEGPRVLVVEDSRDNQILIELLLKKYGTRVEVADNGERGLACIEEACASGRPFNLVLMDMQMPVLDGYEATRRIRRDHPDLPVVALTAHALAGDRERCLEAGCSDFISKPINRDALFRILEQYGVRTGE